MNFISSWIVLKIMKSAKAIVAKAILIAALSEIFCCGLAAAQSPLQLPGEQFGRLELQAPQSIPQGENEKDLDPRNDHFDLASIFPLSHPIRKASQDVGRLDLLYKFAKDFDAICTATLISEKYILTAAHCFYSQMDEYLSIANANFVRGYYGVSQYDNVGAGSGEKLELKLPPVEHDPPAGLDYAIVELKDPIKGEFQPPFIDRDPVQARQWLAIIHHPEGKPMRVTRQSCQILDQSAFSASEIRHRCATLPGSSGAPIFDDIGLKLVGIHTRGFKYPDPAEYNVGIPITRILAKSPIAQQLFSDVIKAAPPDNLKGVKLLRPDTRIQTMPETVAMVLPPVQRAPLRETYCLDDTSGRPVSACQLVPGVNFKDCRECPTMRILPSGEFVMGSPAREAGRFGDEGPQHRVHLDAPFAVGRFHVTVEEFAVFVKDSGYRMQDNCYVWTSDDFKFHPANGSWKNPGYLQSSLDPVACMSWNDAKAYVDWLTKKTSRHYRLLSEAEWEYAARASSSINRYQASLPAGTICDYSNFADPTLYAVVNAEYPGGARCSDGYAFTARVGSFLPNAFGLYDMVGNLLQWTEDCYFDSHRNAPPDGSPRAQDNCKWRVARGASWESAERALRPAFRRRVMPDSRIAEIGIRVAADLN